MSFAEPAFLALLVVVAAMGYIAYRLAHWRQRARGLFAGPQASHWRQTFSIAATIFLLEAAALIVIATARPVWGTNQLTRERQGVDIVFVLDISQSMQGTDVSPTRLAFAQDQIARLIEAERGNRFALVLFAGTPFLRSPLTSDAGAMTELVRRAGNETTLVRTGSDIGAALDQAGLILAASESAGKAVVLISDGEDFAGRYAEPARKLREQDIIVLTAGVGTTRGSQLTETNRIGVQTTKVDASGNPVITRLDEAILRATADSGGGRYIRISDSSNNLLGFREDLSRLKQTPLGEDTQQIPVQRFQVFAAAAFALLLASWVVPLRLAAFRRLPLPHLRLRPQAGMAMLLVALIVGGCSSSDTLRDRNEEANRAYERSSFQEALDIYQQLIAQRPDIAELSYNAGNALHRANLYQRAIQETQRALPPTDARVGSFTYYALGNHYLALEEFELAYDSYRNALLLNPRDADAKHNLEIALLLIAEQLEEEQQQSGQQPEAGNEGDPQPGAEGEGEGMPQEPEQQPAQPGAGTQPPSGSPPAGQPSASEVQRLLEDALRGLNENLSFEEAQRILDLLRQQQQNQRLPGGGTTPIGPDY